MILTCILRRLGFIPSPSAFFSTFCVTSGRRPTDCIPAQLTAAELGMAVLHSQGGKRNINNLA